MASITQSISSYIQGISHQPDNMMMPGQVRDLENALPDVTTGLIKRNGTKFVSSLDYVHGNDLLDGQSQVGTVQPAPAGSWFSYYRDKTEGGYVGVINTYGDVFVWKLDGTPVTVHNFGRDGSVNKYSQYLTNNNTETAENLQFTTINDYTFVTNPSITVKVDVGVYANNDPWRPTSYWTDDGFFDYGKQNDYVNTTSLISGDGKSRYANPFKKFVQIKQLAQGVEYGLQVIPTFASTEWNSLPNHSGGTTNTATRVSIDIGQIGNDDGDCPAVGTGIYKFTAEYVSANVNGPLKEEAIYARITQTGQSHIDPTSTNINSGNDYKCTYNYNTELLYGGRGWNVGDVTHYVVGPSNVASADQTHFRLTVEEVAADEADRFKDTFVKSAPVSFEANNPVNPRQIYQNLKTKLEARGFTCSLQSNGLVVTSLTEFELTAVDETLLNVSSTEIADITDLPKEGPAEENNWFVRISSSKASDVDDYYLKWDNTTKPGRWVETLGDDLYYRIDPFTMPHVLWRQSDGSFVFDQFRGERKGPHKDLLIGDPSVSDLSWSYDYHRGQTGWDHRAAGDNITNPFPSFIGKKIKNTFFHRNRLGFLYDGNISLSKAGSLGNFFNNSALTTTANDPIDIAASSDEPTTFINSIETNTGLVVFGENEQYLLHTDSDSLTSETAKLSNISTYNYSSTTNPIPLGTTIGFVDSTGNNGRFFEMFDIKREGEPQLIEQTKVVQDLLPNNIDLTANSRETNTVFLSKENQSYIWGYRYFNQGRERIQSAWFKWKVDFSIRYIFVIEGQLYVVSTTGKLYSIALDTNGYSITGGANNPWGQPGTLNIHLDGHETHSGMEVFYGSNTTSVVPKIHNYRGGGMSPEGFTREPYAIGADGTIVQGSGNDVTDFQWTFPGVLQEPITTGYAFDLSVVFPKIFFKKQSGNNFVSDVTASLTVQRVKLHFGPVGHTSVKIKRQGKANLTIENNMTFADWIDASGTPVVTERIVEAPIYEKNLNFEMELNSTYPGPASLNSMSWEGEYSTKHHKRV